MIPGSHQSYKGSAAYTLKGSITALAEITGLAITQDNTLKSLTQIEYQRANCKTPPKNRFFSFNKYLLRSYNIVCTVLGARNIVGTQIHKTLCPHGAYEVDML